MLTLDEFKTAMPALSDKLGFEIYCIDNNLSDVQAIDNEMIYDTTKIKINYDELADSTLDNVIDILGTAVGGSTGREWRLLDSGDFN